MEDLRQSTRYKSFVKDRNKEIERIALHTQTDISRLLFEVLDRLTGFVSHMALEGRVSIHNLDYLTKQVDAYLWQQFNHLLPLLVARMKRMRRSTFVLTYFSELEAIARATKRTAALSVHDFKTALHRQTHQETILGTELDTRIWQVLGQLRGTLLDAWRGALVREETPKDVVDALKRSYPQVNVFKLPPRALKPMREAAISDHKEDKDKDKKEFEFYQGLTNDEDWELAVDAYRDTELPESRFDNHAYFDSDAGHFRYDWELEQDINDEFVKQVRDGQIQAANDLGIQEMVWVAILDNKTCDECCLPRNGKTTSEIEDMLASGELGDECDAVAPPAHPFCRCDIAPVASTDEVEGPDWKSFNDWLDS